VLRTAFFIEGVPGEPNKSILTRLVTADPKGSIPTWVINKGKVKSASGFILIRKSLEIRPP